MSFRPVSLLVAGSVALGALAVPAAASAQTYDRYGYGYGDRRVECRDTRGNQTAGAVIGALAGAALGSNVAGRGAKSEGGVIGALAGAAIGAQAAKGASSGCHDRYGSSRYGSTTGYGYGSSQPYYGASSGYGYGRDYGYGSTTRDYGYGYGSSRDYPYRGSERDYDHRRPVGAENGSLDSCRLAESPIYLPDGRTEKRYVRVCADESGRYRVVD
jgi:hypothetical protein